MKDMKPELNALSDLVISAAIEVHREQGPGPLESTSEQALGRELSTRRVPHESLEGHLRLDLVAADAIIVELKVVDLLLPIREAQLLNYLQLTGNPLGLLINFHAPMLMQGLKRLVNTRLPA
jgi:GxxExxY protein